MSREKVRERRCATKARSNCDSDNAPDIDGQIWSNHHTVKKARWVWFDTNCANEGTVQKDAGASWDSIGVVLRSIERQGRVNVMYHFATGDKCLGRDA